MDTTIAPPTPSGLALEPHLYTDPAVLEAEQELIFERTWQLAGHVGSLPRPGSYITARAGSQPVLVMRDNTERQEALEAGTARLVGTATEDIVETVSELMMNASAIQAMTTSVNPYGNGVASKRIACVCRQLLNSD